MREDQRGYFTIVIMTLQRLSDLELMKMNIIVQRKGKVENCPGYERVAELFQTGVDKDLKEAFTQACEMRLKAKK